MIHSCQSIFAAVNNKHHSQFINCSSSFSSCKTFCVILFFLLHQLDWWMARNTLSYTTIASRSFVFLSYHMPNCFDSFNPLTRTHAASRSSGISNHNSCSFHSHHIWHAEQRAELLLFSFCYSCSKHARQNYANSTSFGHIVSHCIRSTYHWQAKQLMGANIYIYIDHRSPNPVCALNFPFCCHGESHFPSSRLCNCWLHARCFDTLAANPPAGCLLPKKKCNEHFQHVDGTEKLSHENRISLVDSYVKRIQYTSLYTVYSLQFVFSSHSLYVCISLHC